MKLGQKTAVAMMLGVQLSLCGALMAQTQQPAAVPDAPTPQAKPSLTDATGGTFKPGIGGGETSASEDQQDKPSMGDAAPATGAKTSSSSQEKPAGDGIMRQEKDDVQTTPPEMPEAGTGNEKIAVMHLNVNFVEVPVTVKDSKGKLVPGLTYRDFQVYENNTREPLKLFTIDPFPLSISFVIDQSLPAPVMDKVNESLGAIQGALTPYDEVAVFSYNNGAQERTGFTGAQSKRLPAVLALTKATGTDAVVPVNSGPLAGCSIHTNGNCADPTIQPGGSAGGSGGWMPLQKEIHTLNDAILAAAKEMSTRPKNRRRIIYVISDGKEYGSKAPWKEVVKYLQTNNIAVYGTAVGDSARWGEGSLSRFHLPFTMYDNILYKYTAATGGTLDSEATTNGIERSYAKIAEEARTQYTLGYFSHQPFIDGKFRNIDVRVNRPNVEVQAKKGYYPNAKDAQ